MIAGLIPIHLHIQKLNGRFHLRTNLLSTNHITRLLLVARLLWDALDMNNFYFLFLLFSDFIGILFSFSFSFLLDDEEAHDTAVT